MTTNPELSIFRASALVGAFFNAIMDVGDYAKESFFMKESEKISEDMYQNLMIAFSSLKAVEKALDELYGPNLEYDEERTSADDFEEDMFDIIK